MPAFTCQDCGTSFELPQGVVDRYPGWTPARCRDCREASTAGPDSDGASDPHTGVFTDGGASPNPGPGGWGAVYVVDGRIVGEAYGHDPDTTNNRMELTAIIEGMQLVPDGTAATIYSDSNVAVRTLNDWAAAWERRGWRRKGGPVLNLDLVRRAYRDFQDRSEIDLEWVKGHAGIRWNEYADRLANRWRNGTAAR